MRNDRERPAAPLGGAGIVYEDADVLVVDKPAGMVSAQVGDSTGRTLFHYVKTYVRHRGRGRGPQAAWVIHRLDREVSGLLVFAKTHSAFLALKDQLKRRQVSRQYLAAVEGEMPVTPGEAPWQFVSGFVTDAGPGKAVRLSGSPPAEDRAPRPRRRPAPARKGDCIEPPRAMRAVTYYRVLAAGKGRSLLAVRIETGRKHQIRAHLASEGHAIVGDALYGGTANAQAGRGAARQGRIALHAHELGLTHPRTGRSMRWSVSPGSEFLALAGAAEEAVTKAFAAPAAPKAEAASVAEGARIPAPAGAGRSGQETGEHFEKRSQREDAGWEHVAPWYEGLLEKGRSDHHEELVLPGVLRLLEVRPRQRVLDVACGEGVLGRRLSEAAVTYVGVDASEHLVAAARRRAAHLPGAVRPTYVVGDARRLLDVPELVGRRGGFDAAACVLAMMNIEPLEPVLQGAAELLAAGGRFVAVVLHPAFRAPGQTSWQWEGRGGRQQAAGSRQQGKDGGRGHYRAKGIALSARQYRRVDAYLSIVPKEIVMNPGEAAHGKPVVTTLTYHRPVQAYVKAFADAGLLIDAMEEWASRRQSQPGPRAAEEDRARREIPMFLAMRGLKR